MEKVFRIVILYTIVLGLLKIAGETTFNWIEIILPIVVSTVVLMVHAILEVITKEKEEED